MARRMTRVARRRLAVALTVLAVLVAAGAFVYAFGAPQAPRATSAAVDVPAPDPSSPLAIRIPGCVCHSDDEKVVAEHAAYRMNQCAGCHKGGVPTGARTP